MRREYQQSSARGKTGSASPYCARGAFLNVPLFHELFANHNGGVLPPAAALEREIVDLGVAEKQKDRARQFLNDPLIKLGSLSMAATA